MENGGPQRLRVSLVASSYHPHFGGVEEHVRHVARELDALGHAVEVWTVDRGERLGAQQVDGITVRYLPTPLPTASPGGVARFLGALPRAGCAWLSAWRRHRPDVLHIQCFGPNGAYASWLGHLTRTPLVLSSHGETFADDHGVFEESRLLRASLRHAVRQADAVTGVSQVVLDDLGRRFGSPGGLIVPNGVEAASAAPDRPVGGSPTIVGVGRLEHMKGFDLVIEALPLITPADARFVVVGDGSQREALGRLASGRGVRDRVEFTGRLDRADVTRVLQSAGVVVVPSRRESFGIVILEAWQAGAPVVVTHLDGPASLVSDGIDGLVVDPQDAEALAGAVSRVLGDRAFARALSDAGRRTVAGFTWRAVAEQYAALYTAARRRSRQ